MSFSGYRRSLKCLGECSIMTITCQARFNSRVILKKGTHIDTISYFLFYTPTYNKLNKCDVYKKIERFNVSSRVLDMAVYVEVS